MPVRVGLRQLHDAPFVRAVGGAVTWHACPAPADPTRRTHDDLCTALTTQPAGTTYHVCQAGTSQRVQTVACGAAGGTVVASATQPILRVHHHGVQIEAPGPNAARCQSDVRDGVGCYRWSAHDIVNVAPGRWNTVQYLRNLQQYLHGLAEMPASWNAAALQAQAIAGRTFALRTIGFRATCSCEILATPAHQAYGGHRTETASGGAWPRAVDATFAGGSGSVLTYDGALAQTFYSSSHGGRTEAVEDSWAYANNPVPYLRSVDDPWSLAEPHNFRSWTSSATNAAVAAHVSSGRSAALSRVERVQILSRTSGGTPREVRVSGVTAAGMPDTFVFTSRAADSPTLQAKRVAGASFRMHLPTTGHPTAAGSRLPSSQIAAIGFAPFTDDDGTTHEYAITWTALAGIAQGVGGARFAPGRDVTRGQMATFLYQTFAIPAPSVRGRFPDVADPDATHALAIDALAQAGVAGGFTDGMFRPGAPVTRAQMATFLTAAAGLRAPAGTADPFVDVRRQAAHGEAIAAVAAAGVAAGCTADGSGYCPGDPVSRGQMASFLRRVATR
nr:SpoIID/LytB domain-containing protein [Egicoccus halophilus]